MIDVARARPTDAPIPRARGLGSFLRRLDWVLLLAMIALAAYGLWAIDGITRFDVPGEPDYYLTRQMVAVGIGAFAFLAGLVVRPSFLRANWRLVYALTVALMILVLLLAEAVRGSKRWIEVGPFQFQPSELGKVLFVVALAGFLADRGRWVTGWRTIAAAIGLTLVPIVLVFLQPDLGTALVYAAAAGAVLLLAGVRWLHLGALFAVGAVVIIGILWLLPAAGVDVLKPYQKARLTGFTNPDSDPSGLTYNVTQSITAIGAGGLDGRGVAGASQTRLDYLPEHATDFVFASLAEQRGFFGAAILLLLYLLVVWRGLRVVTVAPDLFSAMVAGGIVFAFLFQVFVNIGMTMGVAPVTGIPLAFVTVGGSSIVASMLAFGLLQGIHARGAPERP